MFTFVFRLVTTSPSSEYKTIKSRIFKESSHLIFQKFVKISRSRWQVLCLLCNMLKKWLDFRYNNDVHKVLYMWWSLSFLNSEALEWPHHSTRVTVWVQRASVTLPHFIEVSVRSHVCTYIAYRLCLHFYVFLVESWNCPDGVALICITLW